MKISISTLVRYVLFAGMLLGFCGNVYSQPRLTVPESPELEWFLNRMVEQVKNDSQTFTIDGAAIRANPTWIRDHIHELKGYKFWEKDISSALEFLCERQTETGFFYEIFMPNDNPHATYVNPDCIRRYPEDNKVLVRLELEADVEYLMVEGCYQFWQATGDDGWLRKVLPHLMKGLEYCMTDPKRWDASHGLMKRNFTVDTWDFSWGVAANGPLGNRRIEPSIPMAIMHGDNTGLIQACHQVSRLFDHLGDSEAASYWEKKAAMLRQHLFATCWNGGFFTHQVHLGGNPLPKEETSEKKRLSLSNAYALNRGVLDFKQGRSILAEYQNRRKKHGESMFSEWYSIDPPYKDFPNLSNPSPAGYYINGGLCGFVGGELAKGAFNYGEEAYGWELLQRAIKKVKQDGSIFFLYRTDGTNQGGGPLGWSAASFISAVVEGLGGIEDMGALWQKVRVSPRWAVTGLKEASLTTHYGPSETYLGYDWKLCSDRITLKLNGSGVKEADCHVLLPAKKRLNKVIVDGNPIKATEKKLASSYYADFNIKNNVAASGIRMEVLFR